jgi:hypothetical protein
MFTDGKLQQFERMMQQTPSNKPRGGGKRHHKYVYADVACEVCVQSQIKRTGCGFKICPYIMDNLDDLMSDSAFTAAIDNAETCETKHKQTLLYLQSLRAAVDS